MARTSLALEWTDPPGTGPGNAGAVHTAWYSLEDDDNVPNRFVAHLVAAIHQGQMKICP